MKAILKFVWIPAPLILALTSILAALFVPDAKKQVACEFIIKLGTYFQIPLPNATTCKASLLIPTLIFVAIAICAIIWAVFRDYAKFFPREFQIKVYFDEEGIKKTIAKFGDLRQLNLEGLWEKKRKEYFSRLNKDLSDNHIPFVFSLARGETIGEGKGCFEAKLNEYWAFQRYKIEKANGEITFKTISRGSQQEQNVDTQYELLNVDTCLIEPSIMDIYIRRSALIMPEFKQLIKLSQGAPPRYDHFLTAATKVKIWPCVDIGKTLYLVRGNEDGYIPIGYAIYTPD